MVEFDPTVGTEIQKTRPAVVLSADSIGKLPLKLAAPMTGWDISFEHDLWQLAIEPTAANGLSKKSSVDLMQIRGMDIQRFKRKLGKLTDEQMIEITLIIASVIEME